jgi:hypothetical protein
VARSACRFVIKPRCRGHGFRRRCVWRPRRPDGT